MHENEHATGTLDSIGQLDHSVTPEYRIFGPPGTGKTSSVAAHVARAAKRFGGSSVLVTSFSRAAATELVDHRLPLPPEQVGTLHSFCFHVLGKPHIAEANVGDWNRAHPQLPITPVRGRNRLDGEEAVEDREKARAAETSFFWN